MLSLLQGMCRSAASLFSYVFYGIDQTSTPHAIGCAVESDFEPLFRVIYLIQSNSSLSDVIISII